MAPHTTIPVSMRTLYVLAVVLGAFAVQLTDAAMYTCVVYGNNVPSTIQNQIDADTDSLLQKIKGYEGTGYVSVAAGESATRRDLALDLAASVDSSLAVSSSTSVSLAVDCPNTCSNSGSNYCKCLGCAYCGKCRRRDLTATTLRRDLAKAATVEKWINKDLAGYCQGISGCSLWAKIFVVNSDGSLSPAT